ncbi:clpP2 [Symbiodinium sp. KB8]|nr:clpP2 [Symbiodinium sp. KB8]
MSNAGSTAPRPRAQAHSSWLLAAGLVAVVLRSFSGARMTNFVGAPNQLPLRAQAQSSDALQARNDGWYMMPLGVPKVAYRVPGAPNAEWVDIYNRLYRERIIFIGKEIDDKLANEVIGVLLYLDSEDNNKPIYLYINSAGGSVIAGLSIYDTMQHIKSPVITINVGLAASMASFLLAAGEKGKRIALPHSRIMIHQAMGGAQGQAEDIKVEAQQILQIHENIVRMYSRVTGKDQDTIRADLMRDNFMSAEQAKDYGLIDQVIQLSDASDLKAVAEKVSEAGEAPKDSAAPPSPPPEVPDKPEDGDEDEVKTLM